MTTRRTGVWFTTSGKGVAPVLWKDDISRRAEITKTTNETDRINSRLLTLQNQFPDGRITPQDYHRMKERIEKDLTVGSCTLLINTFR